MGATMSIALNRSPGRSGRQFQTLLRTEIVSGKFLAGDFLPTVREFSQVHSLTRKTVNLALKRLELEGLLAAEPRQGYRVQANAADPDRGCPLAFVADLLGAPDVWMPLHQELLAALQGAAVSRGWSLMGIGSQGRTSQEVLRQLLTARACGLILDSVDAGIQQAIQRIGLPAVAVDTWEFGAPIDSIVQDSYEGGVLAAGYLLARGHERIAWLGPTSWSSHSQARVAGTLAGLLRGRRRLDPELIVECPRDAAEEQARELLLRKERPTGIVALYHEVATTLVRVARGLGLRVGADVEVVGWCTEGEYQRDWRPLFQTGPAAPAVVWSPRRMAELAVSRLAERRAHPGLLPVRINVPVTLRTAE